MCLSLLLRRGNYPQLLSKILECLPWQGFCKNVYNLLLCLNIFQLDVLFYYLFPQKMEFDGDMLCFGVHYWVLRYVYCTGFVTKFWNSSSYFILIYSNVHFIQITCVQHAAAAMYYAFSLDKDTEDCFLLDQTTRQFPK